MSEVTERSTQLVAGNTVENLAGADRDVVVGLPSAADLDADAAEKAIKEASAAPTAPDTVEAVEGDEDPLDNENTFDVSRAEFNELQDAFLRLVARVNAFNVGAPHKI